MVLSLVIQGPLAIVLALLLNQKIRGRSIIRVLIFVPYVISEVIVGTGWSLMLQTTRRGQRPARRTSASARSQADWLSDPSIAIWSLMVIISWKYIGFAVILFLAGLQGDPRRAVRGGAHRRRLATGRSSAASRCRCSARPSASGRSCRSSASLQLFDLVYIIWGQYVAATAGTSTMATYMVGEGRNAGNYGYGNAVAVVMFVISLIDRADLSSASSCAATLRGAVTERRSDVGGESRRTVPPESGPPSAAQADQVGQPGDLLHRAAASSR